MIYISFRFDDGDISQYTIGYNTLKLFNQIGSFYIITDKIGEEGYMNIDNLKEMYKDGNQIGSHSCSHTDGWIESNKFIIKKEIIGSKQILKNHGFQPKIFCFPKMKMNEKTEILAKKVYTAVFKKYSEDRILRLNKNSIPSIPTKFGINKICETIKKRSEKDVWLVITFHKITNFPSEYDITPKDFVKILKIVDNGIKKNTHRNVTVEDGFNKFYKI
jgi:peptidoglycan/xylan/chitin deacetylase (PgdA/CDA1 family)